MRARWCPLVLAFVLALTLAPTGKVSFGPAHAQDRTQDRAQNGAAPTPENPAPENPAPENPAPESPAPETEAPPNLTPWTLAVADSADCLRAVDTNPAFAAVRPRMPTAEAMGLSAIDDKAKPTEREREILVRYAEAAATCVPQFFDLENDPTGQAVATLMETLWAGQTMLLRRLAEGGMAWGTYNRESMRLDRGLRRKLAAIRKPAAPAQTPPPPPKPAR